jgi:hypothetical protein
VPNALSVKPHNFLSLTLEGALADLSTSLVDPDSSSTFNIVSEDTFHIQYADFTAADGDYITDDLSVGDITIKALQMGLARSANNTEGLMGIGYTFIEASNFFDDPSTPQDDSFTYPNIMDAMVSQGIINIKAYSLYLDDLDSSSGSIIFGGMDTDKYQGDLIQMPIIPSTLRNGTDVYAKLYVAMTNFKVSSSTDGLNMNELINEDGFEIPVLLDSGAAFSYLPTTLVQFVAQAVNGLCEYDDCSGFTAVDCKLREDSPDMTFDFYFGDESIIRVPVTELIIPFDKLGWELEPDAELPFAETCVLGLIGDDESATLGDTFLRSAYVVYDLTNHVIALAETNFDSEDSNVVDFTADQTAIPNISGTAVIPSITATGTGQGGDDGAFTVTKTASSGRSTRTGTSKSSGTNMPTITVTAPPPDSAGIKSMDPLDLTWLFVFGASFGIAIMSSGVFVMR